MPHDHDQPHSLLPDDPELRVRALESLLVEKGLVDPDALTALIDIYENEIGPRNGARVVARATHVLPDSSAHFHGDAPEPLYAVEFDAQTLWDGDAGNRGDSAVLDLWQSYLEPVKS